MKTTDPTTPETDFARRMVRAISLVPEMSQTKLAELLSAKLGRVVQAQTIQWACSKGKSSKWTADIAEILGVEYRWLAYGDGDDPLVTKILRPAISDRKIGNSQDEVHAISMSRHDALPIGADDGSIPQSDFEHSLDPLGPLKTRTVRAPVVGTASLGFDGFWTELDYPVGHGDGYVMHPTCDANAYALQVKGDSMFPAIRSGFLVLVEPNTPPVVGEFVVVKLRDGRSTVKELLWQRGNEFALQAVNGQARMTLRIEEVEFIHYVAAIVPPSRRTKI